MRGSGPKELACPAMSSAPVGVTSSPCTSEEYTGTPSSSFSVAGAGTGRRPCAV